jgi:hypothetical protein
LYHPFNFYLILFLAGLGSPYSGNMEDYEVDFSGDGFAGLVSVKLDNGEGPFEVRVLKKWALRDYCSSGKLGDVAMVLIDKNVRFFI